MLSFRTTIALQILRLVKDTGEGGCTIWQLKSKLSDIQNLAVVQTVRLLCGAGWLEQTPRGQLILTVDLRKKSLCDLVVAIDGEVRLGSHIEPEWEEGKSPRRTRMYDRVERSFTAKLRAVRVSDMMA